MDAYVCAYMYTHSYRYTCDFCACVHVHAPWLCPMRSLASSNTPVHQAQPAPTSWLLHTNLHGSQTNRGFLHKADSKAGQAKWKVNLA